MQSEWIKKIFLNYIQKLQENQKMKAKLIKLYRRCIRKFMQRERTGFLLIYIPINVHTAIWKMVN